VVENNKVEAFIHRVVRSYYRDYLGQEAEEFDPLIFPCHAAEGAGIFGGPQS
jgi:hypothetical protein